MYIPFLLDVYGSWFLDNKVVYIMLFPLNIWLLELVLGRLFVLILGRNVAWCYCTEPHAAFNGTLRWSHCLQWWALGTLATILYPPFKVWTDNFESRV